MQSKLAKRTIISLKRDMKRRVDDPDHVFDDAHAKLNHSLQKVERLNPDSEEVTTK